MQVDPVYIPPEWDTKQKCVAAIHAMMYKLGAGREMEDTFSHHYNAAYYLRMHFAKEGRTGSADALDPIRRGLRRIFLHYARGYAKKAHIYQTERLRTCKRQNEICEVVNGTIGLVFDMRMADTTVFATSNGGAIALGSDEARLFDQDPRHIPAVMEFVADFVTGVVRDVDPGTRWGLKLHITKQYFDFIDGRKTQLEVAIETETLMLDHADFRAVLESVDPHNKPSVSKRATINALMAKRGLVHDAASRLAWNLDRLRELGRLIGHVAVVRERCLLAWNEYVFRPENVENVVVYKEARARFEAMSA